MMSDSVQQHRAAASDRLRVAVITVSDTRSIEDDTGGASIIEYLSQAGHETVLRTIVPDDREQIVEAILDACAVEGIDAVLTTGGTGIARRDVTYEAVDSILTRRLDGFGELFRMLSFDEIGAAAMLSRAIAGTVGAVAVFAMPGSRNAIRLAMEKLILPELAHVVYEIRK